MVLSIGAVPSDFSQLNQLITSVTLNGVELLSTEGCSPVGQCNLGSYFTCFQGDITEDVRSSQDLVLVATASPAVQSPCLLCGTESQVPCDVLVLQYTLFTVVSSTSTAPPPPTMSPAMPPPAASPPLITFTQTPLSFSNMSVATFEWIATLTATAESCYGCVIECQLDFATPELCLGGTFTANGLSDKLHYFTVIVTGPSGAESSSTFNWSVATQGPVPELAVNEAFTRSGPVQLNITFDKLCSGNGGIECSTNLCEIVVSGGLKVNVSSFTTVVRGLLYSVLLDVEANETTEANVTLLQGACSDSSGNPWVVGPNSTTIVAIDLNPPTAQLSCQLPVQETSFFQEGRSFQTTNSSSVVCEVLFSEPVAIFEQSQIMVTNGSASNVSTSTNGTYVFDIVPTGNGPVTVRLPSGTTTDIVGNPTVASNEVVFFFDNFRPEVKLTSSSEPTASVNAYGFLVAFSEPVVNFNASHVDVSNGEVICLTSADGGLGRFFQMSVAPLAPGTVEVAVRENSVTDVTGNANGGSEKRIVHYYKESSPARISSYVVAGVFGWTALVTGSASLAVALREADPGASPGIRIVSNRPFRAVSTPVVGADPARNLLRLALHLQIFALSEQLAVTRLPGVYRQLAGGLKWSTLRLPLPFSSAFHPGRHSLTTTPTQIPGGIDITKQSSCLWTYSENATVDFNSSLARMSTLALHKTMHMTIQSQDTTESGKTSFYVREWSPRRRLADSLTNGSLTSQYGPDVLPPLTVEEYNYKMAWGNAFRTNFPNLNSNYHGWKEYITVVFYAAILIIGLTLLQVVLQLLCVTYRGQWLYGLMDPPRLQFFCVALSLVAISWGSAHIIRGSTESGGKLVGLILGVITLNLWPVLFVLASIIIVWVVVVQEQFARFFVREMTEPREDSCFSGIARFFWTVLWQKRLKGHWVTITPAQRHILPRLGIFFEDYTVWGLNGFFGVLKDRLRVLYGAVEYSRMIAIGVVFAVWTENDNSSTQVIALLGIIGANFLYLLVFQPFTERGIQVAEAISLLCELLVFVGALLLIFYEDWTSGTCEIVAYVMLALMLLAFVAQLINHWAALVQQMNRMFYPSDDEKSPSHNSESEVYTDDDISGDIG